MTVIMSTPALGLIKMSLLIQYYLLFSVYRYIRIRVLVGAVVFGIFYVAVSITAFVLNSPWGSKSLLSTVVSWHYLKFANFTILIGVVGIVFDWYILLANACSLDSSYESVEESWDFARLCNWSHMSQLMRHQAQ
jgi:hypothetical protein